jgi:hypothetical protein
MGMAQMLERLLAGKEQIMKKAEADRKADREAIKEEIRVGQAEIRSAVSDIDRSWMPW